MSSDVPSKKPKVKKNSKPSHPGSPLTYLNWMAIRTVVVSMTVATANLREDVSTARFSLTLT